MKRVAQVLLGLVAAGALLMLIAGLAIQAMLSGAARESVTALLASRIHAPVSIEGGEFDLAQWFRLRPSITLSGFAIGNPEGFSPGRLLEAESISAQVALLPLLSDRVEIQRIELVRPRLHLESNERGQSNLGALFQSPPVDQPGTSEPAAQGELAIRELVMREGGVRYVARDNAEPLTIEAIDLLLTDFAPDSSCRFELGGRLFGGERSRLAFSGGLGPFSSETIPAQGSMRLEVAPAEFPATLRESYFGDLLRNPEAGSSAVLESDVQGDLLGELRGAGNLSLEQFRVGPSPERSLELLGEVPLEIILERPLGELAITLEAPGAALQLGSGRWQGDSEFRFREGRLEGAINGSIDSVDINEFLSAFTEAAGKVYGTAQMPELRLRFAGTGGDELMNSLSGSGTVTMEDGKIVALDVFQSVAGRVQKVLAGEAAAAGETQFVRFSSVWRVAGRRLELSEMLLDAGASSLSGAGSVGFDHALDFDLRTTFRGDLAARIGGRPDAAGTPAAEVPVKISGTVDAPRVRPNIGQIAKEQVTERVSDLLDSIFDKSTPVEKPPETER